ncbi:MAG TPA: hypothetical protein VMN57_02265 [Anaerolineales bacterium]|nr:hypothetical protein [Anaerolineales bacterium]
MKKKLILLVAALVLALLVPAAVMAQSPGGLAYTSGVQVVNLDSTTASIGLTYYNQDGSVATTFPDTIAGNGSKTYFPIQADVGFNGSLVISSNKPITAIANTVTTDFKYGAATTSFSAGATTVNLPLIMCNNSGFNTWFNVQNTHPTENANITINYAPGVSGVGGSENASIPPGAAKTFNQATGSSTKNCSTLGPTFIGSASVTSNHPVVATVMQLNTTSFATLLGYNGFISAGSTSVVVPLVMAQNSGFFSGIQIQNVDGSSTDVTIVYAPNQVANGFQPANETCNGLGAGDSCTLIQAGGQWTQTYIGSATITGSQNLVATVNQISLGNPNAGPYGTSYEGFNPATATSNIATPLIMSNNSGYFTGIQVMNVGGGACASVTIDYGPNSGGPFNPVNEVFSLGAGESHSVLQTGSPPGNGGANTWGANKYIGSAQISAPGCSIVATVNELAIKKGDNFFTYIGYNH